MTTLAVAALVFVGCALLLSDARWFRRPPLDRRLAPYLPGGPAPRRADHGLARSFRQLVAPRAIALGTSIGRLLGVSEDLAVRLERVHTTTSAAEFRLRQLGWCTSGFAVAVVLVAGSRPPAGATIGVVLGVPLLGFLVVEQRLIRAAQRWQRRVFLELPVVSEQLGMLLSAGYSVGAALNRLASGGGACARDLQRVCQRIRHGIAEHDALAEWAAVSGVPAVGRLVAVLALDREAGDLARLITEEARAVRREVHRELIQTIERRSQQVWIPVTVATLVPGVLFLVAPFASAMQLFAGS